jgi:hypothetical protein
MRSPAEQAGALQLAWGRGEKGWKDTGAGIGRARSQPCHHAIERLCLTGIVSKIIIRRMHCTSSYAVFATIHEEVSMGGSLDDVPYKSGERERGGVLPRALGEKGDGEMFARVSTYEGRPEQLDEMHHEGIEDVLPALEMQDGFSGAWSSPIVRAARYLL